MDRFARVFIAKASIEAGHINCDNKCFDFICYLFTMNTTLDDFECILSKLIHDDVEESDKIDRLCRFRSIAGVDPQMNKTLFNCCLDLCSDSIKSSVYVTFAVLQIFC